MPTSYCTNSKCVELHAADTPCIEKYEEELTLERAKKIIARQQAELIRLYNKTWV